MSQERNGWEKGGPIKNLLLDLTRPLSQRLNRYLLTRYYLRNIETLPAPLYGREKLNKEDRVVILTPHVDDDVVGVGGTLQRHLAEGAEVHCLYITDGSFSRSHVSKAELIAERKKEAQEVAELLGITGLHFLDLPDSRFHAGREEGRRLADLLNRIRPTLLYLPFYVDGHRDHVETNKLFAASLPFLQRTDFLVRAYEINCPIHPQVINCVVEITPYFEKKLEAIHCYRSQIIDFEGFIELNQYKAALLPIGEEAESPRFHPRAFSRQRAAEVFVQAPLEIYVGSMWEAVEGREIYTHFVQVNKSQRMLYSFFKGMSFKAELIAPLRREMTRESCAEHPLRIGVLGNYGHHNNGDEAILMGLIDQLTAQMPGAELSVFSFDAADTLQRHPNVHVVPLIIREGRKTDLFASYRGIYRACKKLDLLLVGGGALMMDTFRAQILLYAGVSWIARQAGVKLYYYAVGVGPIETRWGRFLIKQSARQAVRVTVRDQESRRTLRQIGVKVPVHVVADPAFGLEPAQMSHSDFGLEIPDRMRVVAISTMPYYYPGADSSSNLKKYWHYVAQMRRVLDHLLAQEDVMVILFGTKYLQDVQTAKHVAEAFTNHARVQVLDREMYPEELMALLARCDLLLGTRLHSLILATVVGTPNIGLAYRSKVRAIKEDCGRGEWVVELEGNWSGQAIEKLDQLMANLPQERQVEEKVWVKQWLLTREHARNLAEFAQSWFPHRRLFIEEPGKREERGRDDGGKREAEELCYGQLPREQTESEAARSGEHLGLGTGDDSGEGSEGPGRHRTVHGSVEREGVELERMAARGREVIDAALEKNAHES